MRVRVRDREDRRVARHELEDAGTACGGRGRVSVRGRVRSRGEVRSQHYGTHTHKGQGRGRAG